MGRPRKYHTEEQRKSAKAVYLREWKRIHYPARKQRQQPSAQRAEAAYDPARDGVPQYQDLTAQICGDPPIGRREFLDRLP